MVLLWNISKCEIELGQKRETRVGESLKEIGQIKRVMKVWQLIIMIKLSEFKWVNVIFYRVKSGTTHTLISLRFYFLPRFLFLQCPTTSPGKEKIKIIEQFYLIIVYEWVQCYWYNTLHLHYQFFNLKFPYDIRDHQVLYNRDSDNLHTFSNLVFFISISDFAYSNLPSSQLGIH